MLKQFLFLGSLWLTTPLQALPLQPLSEKTLSSLCSKLNSQQQPEALFFAEVESAGFSSYNSTKGILPIEVSSLRALSGGLVISVPPETLEAKISPDAAKRLLALSGTSRLNARAAFRITSKSTCSSETSDLISTYKLSAELLLLEIVRKSNDRPLLRYETKTYQQERATENAKIVVTEPSILDGDPNTNRLGSTLDLITPALRRCYGLAIASNEKAQGTLTTTLSLTSDGTIQDVIVTIDTLGDEEARRCVLDALRTGKFAALSKNTSFSVTFYFLQD